MYLWRVCRGHSNYMDLWNVKRCARARLSFKALNPKPVHSGRVMPLALARLASSFQPHGPKQRQPVCQTLNPEPYTLNLKRNPKLCHVLRYAHTLACMCIAPRFRL